MLRFHPNDINGNVGVLRGRHQANFLDLETLELRLACLRRPLSFGMVMAYPILWIGSASRIGNASRSLSRTDQEVDRPSRAHSQSVSQLTPTRQSLGHLLNQWERMHQFPSWYTEIYIGPSFLPP